MDLMRELMKGAGAGPAGMGENPWPPKGSAEDMISVLDEATKTAGNPGPCPFNVGDYVTPKKNAGDKGRGRPMKVIEVYPEARFTTGEPGHPVRWVTFCASVMLRDECLLFEHNHEKYEKFDPNLVGK